ncbi:MAG: SufS family cysteine desulfurase [bacterium]
MPQTLEFIFKIRQDFPILRAKIQDKDLVYFDNAATTQKPQVLIDSLSEYYSKYNANTHSQHFLASNLTLEYENVRSGIALFLGAKLADEIVFTKGATESLNLLAYCLETEINPEDEILITQAEHHANILPWQRLVQEKQAKLVVAPMLSSGKIDLTTFQKLLNPKTKIVAFTHVSNVLGVVNEVTELTKLAHKNGSLVVIDGTQAVGHFKVDVTQINCDFYVFSSHKVFGPMGVGVLYGKQKLLNGFQPYQVGGEMVKTVSFETTTFQESPQKFEAGTQNFADIIAFGKTLQYLQNLRQGLDLESYEQDLLKYTTSQLLQIPGLIIHGTANQKIPLISFTIESVDSLDLATFLDEQGIAIRVGSHCAQPLIKSLGLTSTARISLAFYNTFEEVDFMIEQIQRALKILR